MIHRFWDKKTEEYASRGTVLRSEQSGVGISAQVDAQAMQLVHPYGVYSIPCEQDEVIVIPTQDGKYVLLGVVSESQNINQGEILLKSKSGAYIKLRQDGCVEMNGLIVNPDGSTTK